MVQPVCIKAYYDHMCMHHGSFHHSSAQLNLPLNDKAVKGMDLSSSLLLSHNHSSN